MKNHSNIARTLLLLASTTLAIGCDDEPDNAVEPNDAVEAPPHVAGPVEALPDMKISNAIERELFTDPATNYPAINVETMDGIVTLSGTVDNLLAKNRAGRLASVVKGVRSVINRIVVEPPARTDAEVRTDVEQALISDPAADSYEIEVTVNNQNVTLGGSVGSYHEALLATTLAESVRGVVAVDNQIRVQYETERTDEEIEADISSRLRWDALVDGALIDVDVIDGNIEMSGAVGSLAEKNRAMTNAWVAGVRSVSASGLEVQWWAKEEQLRRDKYVINSDDELEAAIRDALVTDPRVSPFELQVAVDDGVVQLSGQVNNLEARRAAAEVVRHTAGVVAVEDQLRVQVDSPLDDALLTSRTLAALLRSPLLAGVDLDVSVDDGVALLSGNVLTSGQRAEAEEIVSSIAGIEDVVNGVVVEVSNGFSYDPYAHPHQPRLNIEDHAPHLPLHSDPDLVEDIESQLFWSPFVDADQVTVTVDDGVATLHGVVDTYREQEAAIDSAYEGGAVSVVDSLDVRLAVE